MTASAEPPAGGPFALGDPGALPPELRELARRQAAAMRLREALTKPAPLTSACVVAIAAVHLTLFWLALVLEGRLPRSASDLLMSIPGALLERFGATVPELLERHEPWRLVTSALLHGNLVHLAMNALTLISVGRVAERLLGAGALALALVLGAVTGALASALAHEHSVGASGAIVAVAGLLASGLRGEGLPPGLGRALRARMTFVIAILIILGVSANRVFTAADLPVAVSNWAHAAGFAAGLLAGLLVPAPFVEATPLRRFLFRVSVRASVAIGVALLAAGVISIAASFATSDGSSFRGRLAVAGKLNDMKLPRLGLEVAIPETWKEVEGGKGFVAFGPERGAPFFQLSARERSGELGPDIADPDVFVGLLRDQVVRDGGSGFAASPLEETLVDGRPAARLKIAYRLSGTDFEQVCSFVRGSSRVYSIRFLAPDGMAEPIEQRLIGHVRIDRE